jgi:hypothetical protein
LGILAELSPWLESELSPLVDNELRDAAGESPHCDMKKRSNEDSRLVRLTRICGTLPEVTRTCHGSHATFLVRKKIFSYFLNDHHGDGIVAVTCKVLPGDNVALAAAQPARFYLPPYIGPRGWIALRLDVGKIDWEEVSELVTGSYRLVAPKSLAGLVKTFPA